MEEDFRSRTPWNWQPYLSEMCEEVGVNYDRFMEGLANNKSDMEIAGELDVNPRAIGHLREHFENYGIGSVLGQD
ncbi:helix-turn-helix domain-containing protein [Candidatus Formimonas warabiya]|uniref:helix-turn-helix domain-containing protein n=1 Tax=Formimonas warabiya TaxID=1761012 RepID=UPI0011D097B2|nr:helix-turn-helix domain-containing protein [Candidatus Formimonas warabiya]